MDTYEVRHYVDERGNDLYQDWIMGLRDQVAKVAIYRRVARIAVGNFGDHKFLPGRRLGIAHRCGPGLSGLLRSG